MKKSKAILVRVNEYEYNVYMEHMKKMNMSKSELFRYIIRRLLVEENVLLNIFEKEK